MMTIPESLKLGPKKPRQEQGRKRLRQLYIICIHTYIHLHVMINTLSIEFS